MKYFLMLFGLLVCSSANAEWSKHYDFSYTMGDGDTRGSARQAAIEQIKLKASSEAGTYIDSTSTLKEDGSLTESVQMIGATMVKVVVNKEGISISPSGQMILEIVATATLDDAELSKRVSILRQDKEKARQMKVLQVENEALRQSLQAIRASLLGKADPATVANLLAKQDLTIKKLELNGQTVTQVFSQGTLLQLATKNKDALADEKALLDVELYEYLMGVKISAVLEGVEQDGDDYLAIIKLGWNVDLKKVAGILEKRLDVPKYAISNSKKLAIPSYSNTAGKGVNSLSHSIYKHLVENAVIAKISIGDVSVEIPVLYGGEGWHACQTSTLPDNPRFNIPENLCVVSQSTSSNEILGSQIYSVNPIRVRLTKKQAEAATSVSAVMILKDKATADRLRFEEAESRRIKERYGFR